ncbi:MAG TPA: bifunctional diaminohydroxyphosphoribosylaminopyrimidine deaminase/5-amino-6-(5-phosphoribosylamino)uracil reductase RibD [Elusimicrobiota bacterium]|jgi:diaminohydroxyphosphoribosylaminopyrimidine deaminase/5-amino-6-(5-phosphoribosylamino)uracil reductase|nr:bifunctional diaminohydroxyphosphoribosylaminopyrimidine deaminase/5-amino-6-(5-phosphoribosylamino)uracil reductase RibD [Elusimicrobiota bacterium]
MKHARFLARAVALAGRVPQRAVSPNPRVGCVLVKNGRVVGEGSHRRFGGPHAEAVALGRAGVRAKGATAYVTLEPCAPFAGKKTASCAQALASAGVSRVIFVSPDPNPKVAGRGIGLLKRAGVLVERRAELAAEAEALNRGFFSRMRRGRPWVILKTALSLDGKAAAANGRSRWVTGKAARDSVHRMRAELDAILVGAGTVLADDPALTAHGAGPNPLRVVLAGKRPLPPDARVFDESAPTVVYRVLKPGDLRAALRDLAREGVGTLLLEGGPTIHAAFLRAGLVDEARVFLAPKLLSGADDPNAAPRLKTPRMTRVGEDWLVQGLI